MSGGDLREQWWEASWTCSFNELGDSGNLKLSTAPESFTLKLKVKKHFSN